MKAKALKAGLVAAVLCLALMPVAAFADECSHVWTDGGYCKKCYEKQGAVACDHVYDNGFCERCDGFEKPSKSDDGEWWLIDNAGKLYWLADLTNSGWHYEKARLTADITVNEGVLDADGSLAEGDFREWTPIGDSRDTRYIATFDGQGHTISGLYLDDETAHYVGLFGYLDGTVEDVTVTDSYLNAYLYVGGIAGYSDFGKVYDCSFEGSISGTTRVGGIVGMDSYGKVLRCYNAGDVTGDANTGGIAGGAERSTVEDCYNAGDVAGVGLGIGGIAGKAVKATIRSCHNVGVVTSNDHRVGGVLGAEEDSTASGCYYLAGAAAGGISSEDVGGAAEARSAEAFASGEVCWLLNGSTASEESVWYQVLGTDPYPAFEGRAVLFDESRDPQYYNSDHAHAWADEWSGDDANHWHACTVRGCAEVTGSAAHAGGTATCGARAVCETCGASYGNALGHSFAEVAAERYLASYAGCESPATYYRSCSACGAASAETFVSEEALGHLFDNDCDTTCNREGCDHVREISHDYPESWAFDSKSHWRECSVCGGKAEEAVHVGGTATCAALAACEVCGAGYGEYAEHMPCEPWINDYKTHWHECSVSECAEKVDEDWHDEDADGDNVCDVCGYEIGEVIRLAGKNRYETMRAIVSEGFAEGSCEWAIVATGDNFPDALAASALAGALDAPIILTNTGSLSAEASAEIKRVGASKILIIGGEGAVAADVALQIEAIESVESVERVCGGNRFETALAIYEKGVELGVEWSDAAIIATSSTFADALSISPYAYATASPVFLADPKSGLSEDAIAAIHDDNFARAVIVGGTASVPESVASALAVPCERLSGKTRYETSLEIAKWAVEEGALGASSVAFATGANFPDALAGGALCGANESVLLLVEGGAKDALSWIDALESHPEEAYVLGGTASVSERIESDINVKLFRPWNA